MQLEAHPIPYPPLICGYAGLAELLTASAKSLTHVSLETTLYMSKWPHHVAAGEFTSHLGRCEVHSLPRWSEPTFLGQVQDLIEQLPKQVLRQLFTWLPRLAMKFFNWQPALYQLLDCGIHFSKPLPAMPALRRLYLSGFDMSLPYLGCSSGLQCLSIHSCDQVNLDSIQWDSLGCLAYLDLFHIPGACLPSRFSLLTGLQTFTLRACNMTAIHPDALNGLSALTSLTLHMCDNLGQLPQNLSILTNLQQLTLSMCKLWTSLPSAIGNLSLLTSLDAGFHEMTQIPNSISQLGNLKQLNLGYCKSLTSLPQDISGLTSLTRLCIQWCKSLTDIGEGISGLQKLEVLQANDCLSLSQLPTGMGSMTSLQQLKLTNNRLQALPEGFGQMLALTDLDLHDCWYLESLPPEFGQLQGLVRLDLSDCRALEALPHEFGALTNLMSLKLECCIALKRLPDCLTRLTRLQPVSLVDCCSLEPLSAAVEGMNCFTDFDKTVFADFLRYGLHCGH